MHKGWHKGCRVIPIVADEHPRRTGQQDAYNLKPIFARVRICPVSR
jgi:hypothetical protein